MATELGDAGELGVSLRAFNQILREEARASGARFVDLFPLMEKQAQAGLVALDHLHPSAEAYAEWTEELVRRIDPGELVKKSAPKAHPAKSPAPR